MKPMCCFENLFDPTRILAAADEALRAEPESITQVRAEMSAGGPHDYFSMGDYWWPNPDTSDGLPYVRRDGQLNPNAFPHHRQMLRRLRTRVARLAAAYLISGRDVYAGQAASLLEHFFLAPATRMQPHLEYAQAIPGRCTGRGIGIIDTLHLVEVPAAVEILRRSPEFPAATAVGLQDWSATYLHWMRAHEYGIAEMNTRNNHAVCWFVQAAAFARFIGDGETLQFCRQQFRERLIPDQMAPDGRFPRELKRTKPYGYSIFVVDNLASCCQLASLPGEGEDDLWHFTLADGRGMRKAMAFLFPYIEDKSRWPYPPDVESFDGWPAAFSGLLFAGLALDEPRYVALWKRLDADPQNAEIRRNLAVREPLLWLSPPSCVL